MRKASSKSRKRWLRVVAVALLTIIGAGFVIPSLLPETSNHQESSPVVIEGVNPSGLCKDEIVASQQVRDFVDRPDVRLDKSATSYVMTIALPAGQTAEIRYNMNPDDPSIPACSFIATIDGNNKDGRIVYYNSDGTFVPFGETCASTKPPSHIVVGSSDTFGVECAPVTVD